MEGELEAPETGLCPLCNDEIVEFRRNKAEKPYFQCMTLQTVVNLNSDDSDEFVLAHVEEAADDGGEGEKELAEGEDDGDESGDSHTLADIVNNVEDE